MVSDLISFMTTSSLPRLRGRLKAPDGGRYGSRPERSLVVEIVSSRLGGVNPQTGENILWVRKARHRLAECGNRPVPAGPSHWRRRSERLCLVRTPSLGRPTGPPT